MVDTMSIINMCKLFDALCSKLTQGEDEDIEAFDNIESQTIERFHLDYLKSGGDPKFRIVVLGVWTVDLKKRIIMLSDDKDNTDLHRFILRGKSHQ